MNEVIEGIRALALEMQEDAEVEEAALGAIRVIESLNALLTKAAISKALQQVTRPLPPLPATQMDLVLAETRLRRRRKALIPPKVNDPPEPRNPFWDEVKPLVRLADMPWKDLELFHENWYETRDIHCRRYAWAVTDPASLDFVVEHLGPRAIEIGSGNGYWAWQLAQRGVDIKAYDEKTPDKEPNPYFAPRGKDRMILEETVSTWYPVAQGDAYDLLLYPGRTLFLCWPLYDDPMALSCLHAYRGNRLVFIGEDQGGCTGDDGFFEELEDQWREVAEHRIVQWWGINDRIMVYERKKKVVMIPARPRRLSPRRIAVAERRIQAGKDVLRRPGRQQ